MGMVAEYCWCFQPSSYMGHFEPCRVVIFVLKIAWLSIGLSSWRFRKAWVAQGRSMDEMKFKAGWTWPWGPPFVVRIAEVYLLQFKH